MPKQPKMTVSTFKIVRFWMAGSIALSCSMSTLVAVSDWLTSGALTSAVSADMMLNSQPLELIILLLAGTWDDEIRNLMS